MAAKTNSFRSLIAANGQAPVAKSSPDLRAVEPPTKSRVVGKRTAPDYIQVGLYLPKQLHRKAKLALLQEGEDRVLMNSCATCCQSTCRRPEFSHALTAGNDVKAFSQRGVLLQHRGFPLLDRLITSAMVRPLALRFR